MKKLNSIYKIQFLQILLIVLISNVIVIGQGDNNKFIDERDGKEYELIEIDQIIWFTEDLRYYTQTSYQLIREGEKEKYFYSKNNLDSLCPEPFRIPPAKEW